MSSAPLVTITLALTPFPAVAALHHVATCISSYLDGSMMIPFDEACSTGSIRLLDRIWETSDPDAETATTWSLSQYLRADTHYHRFQFNKALLVEIMIKNKINVILWGGDDIINAIAEGHGRVAKWLYENTPDARRNFDTVMKYAVLHGDRSLAQWLLDVVYTAEPLLPPPSMDDAAAGGHMEMLQWIYDQSYGGCSDNALEGAAKNGRLDMVQWLVEKGITKGSREAVQAACSEGHLSVVRWLLERGNVPYPHFAMNCAVRQGHLNIVKYLGEVGIASAPSLMLIDAAMNGHLHLIKWLLEKYNALELFPKVDPTRFGRSSQTAMDRAANNGHLHVLKFLYSVAVEMQNEGKSEGPTCTSWALQSAASMGHLEVVKWLQKHYPNLCFAPSTTIMVARNGNLEMLQWHHDRDDVEWSADVMDSAAENGHLAVVKWLHKNRSEGCTTNAMDYSARNGHLKVVRWLQLHRSEGCTVDAMDFAAGREHFEVLLFLRAHRREGCTATAKIFAREHEQWHIRKWLKEHYPESGLQ
ncbi:Ankyrin repeats (many copies) [Phytophthora infestans]|uniref:Ankyrin repeats (Many copies) n=1 Tax=Phytophthora infestans TaxID=4787 RepID=A0A8S9UQA0_PHYIN|nr:Ankyrin repeats (many copies) [Phytophthora infestans]